MQAAKYGAPGNTDSEGKTSHIVHDQGFNVCTPEYSFRKVLFRSNASLLRSRCCDQVLEPNKNSNRSRAIAQGQRSLELKCADTAPRVLI